MTRRGNLTTASIICGPDGIERLLVPMIDRTIQAGQLQEIVDATLDRNALYRSLVMNPEHTYAMRAKGESMTGAGIDSGDILLIDRALPRKETSIVIAEVDHEYTVKRFEREGGKLYLVPSNPAFDRIQVRSHQHCSSWGVVTFVIKTLY